MSAKGTPRSLAIHPEPGPPASETEEDRLGGEPSRQTQAFLFVILECDQPWVGGSRFSLTSTDEVWVGRGRELTATRDRADGANRLILTVPGASLSAQHARLLRAGEQWALRDKESRNGTWVNERRVDHAALSDGDLLRMGSTFFLFRRYSELPTASEWPDFFHEQGDQGIPGLSTLSPELTTEYDALRAISSSKVPVLLLGETGTGKEVTARAIHQLSQRRGPFCAVNCGAIPGSLVESVLFGHVKGAFSGAVSNELGLVRSAEGGTLLLDEIGDLPLSAQASLLRVLQEGEVLPVGSTRPVAVDLRVLAATHRPLPDLVSRGLFRADLYARLAGFVHPLAPLASRKEDLGLLLSVLLQKVQPDPDKRVPFRLDAGAALVQHAWPLNIRELEQVLARATALQKTGPIELVHLPSTLKAGGSLPPAGKHPSEAPGLEQELNGLLREHRGNISAVARAMGKGPTQIQRWMKRFGISNDRYRG